MTSELFRGHLFLKPIVDEENGKVTPEIKEIIILQDGLYDILKQY
jgi:hypothetical protein